jgi:uracil-DNA glycosylase family 4
LNDLFEPPIASLASLRRDEARCRLRPCDATQVVPGEGNVGAALMLVGEQPGDSEDLGGKPFVGPAGRVLDHALVEAGIRRGGRYRSLPLVARYRAPAGAADRDPWRWERQLRAACSAMP